MKHNQNNFTPEAATDEPASPPNPALSEVEGPIAGDEGPAFASDAERDAYWRGVTQGIREAGREPGHPHMPADFDLGLTRDGAEPGLVSSKLLEAWPHNPHDADPALLSDPKTRHDGWDPAKERIFITTLSDTGVVSDACRACKMSRNAAYERRRSASGRAFALAWDAACLLARAPLSDDVMSRARHGVIERVYRNGELVAERHRYDNRLTMAVLTRLDRLAEGLGEGAAVARAIAQEFDRFLDLLPEGVEGAEKFLSSRFPTTSEGEARELEEPPSTHGGMPAPGTESALLARLGAYQDHGVGLPEETKLDDLDSAEMERWTDEQWDRAQFSGFLKMVAARDWPESARDPARDDTDGMCHLRKLYLGYHPPKVEPEPEPEDDFCGRGVWEDDDGQWVTDFPPPDGFEDWQDGDPGDEMYRRPLTAAEREAYGVDEESEAAEAAATLAEEREARDRFFGFRGDAAPAADAEESGDA